MDLRQIPTEGTRIDPIRNQPRVVLDVEPMSPTGTVIGPHYFTGAARIEVYLDQVKPLLDLLDSPHSQSIREMARKRAMDLLDERVEELGEDERKVWKELRELPSYDAQGPTARLAFLLEHRIDEEALYQELLRLFGGRRFKTPTLRSCAVVDQTSGETIGLREFFALSQAEQTRWVLPPYATQHNAASVGAEAILREIRNALIPKE